MMSETNKNMPRDTFLYLLAIITLVVSAVGFGMAVFNYIDFYFPDLAVDYYRTSSSYESPIRQAMAMLIVVFPVFFFVSRFLRNDIKLNPEKRDLKIRKWLLYLTLFAAALVIIGDLVTVINNFLRGELTARFVLKALTIFFISGSAFYYYLSQLRDKGVRWLGLFSWVVVGIVVVAVGWGFVVIGSPFEQRAKRFDETIISDLQIIQNQVINYWQNKGSLPVNLNVLTDNISGFIAPIDPETGNAYGYRILNAKNLMFEICADFNTSSIVKNDYTTRKMMAIEPTFNWQHEIGMQCFERTVDPEIYQLPDKPLPRPL